MASAGRTPSFVLLALAGGQRSDPNWRCATTNSSLRIVCDGASAIARLIRRRDLRSAIRSVIDLWLFVIVQRSFYASFRPFKTPVMTP